MQKLYICEFTLAFFPQRDQLLRHIDKAKRRCPPGTEIYRNGNISMFEVDGASTFLHMLFVLLCLKQLHAWLVSVELYNISTASTHGT